MTPSLPGTIRAEYRTVPRSRQDPRPRCPLPAPDRPTFLCFTCGKVWTLTGWDIDQLNYVQKSCDQCGTRYSHPEYGWGRHILQALVKYRRFIEKLSSELFVCDVVWSMQARPGMDASKVPATTEVGPVTGVTRQVKYCEMNSYHLWGDLKQLEVWCESCQRVTVLSRARVMRLYQEHTEPPCRICGDNGPAWRFAREGLAAMIRLVYYAERAAWSGLILGPPVWLGSEPLGWDILPKTEEEITKALVPHHRLMAVMQAHTSSSDRAP